MSDPRDSIQASIEGEQRIREAIIERASSLELNPAAVAERALMRPFDVEHIFDPAIRYRFSLGILLQIAHALELELRLEPRTVPPGSAR